MLAIFFFVLLGPLFLAKNTSPHKRVFFFEKKRKNHAVGRVEQKILEELMILSLGERTFVSVFSKKRRVLTVHGG